MGQLKNKRTMILLVVTILASLVLGYDLLFGKKGPRPGKKSSNVPTVAEVLAARPSPSRSPGMPAGTPTRRLAPPPPRTNPGGGTRLPSRRAGSPPPPKPSSSSPDLRSRESSGGPKAIGPWSTTRWYGLATRWMGPALCELPRRASRY